MAVKRLHHDQHETPGGLTPDFTEEIMQRLGFRRVDEAEARRRRVRRWTGRGVVALLMLGAFGTALVWHANSDRARRPNEVTFDEAIDTVAREGEAMRRAWVRTVDHARRLFPAPGAVSPQAEPDGNVLDAAASAEIDPVRPEPSDRSPVPWSGLL